MLGGTNTLTDENRLGLRPYDHEGKLESKLVTGHTVASDKRPTLLELTLVFHQHVLQPMCMQQQHLYVNKAELSELWSPRYDSSES